MIMPLTFFPSQKAQLKAKAIDLDRVALTLIDGKRRFITQGVSLSITHSEISAAGQERRHFTLHSKRGTVPPPLTAWLRAYLTERGWHYERAKVQGASLWEGVFQKSTPPHKCGGL